MKRKNIILCFDGTGGEHFHRTNPLLIASLAKKIPNQVVWLRPRRGHRWVPVQPGPSATIRGLCQRHGPPEKTLRMATNS